VPATSDWSPWMTRHTIKQNRTTKQCQFSLTFPNLSTFFRGSQGFHGYQQKMKMKNFLLLIQKKEKIRTFATVFEPW
jgi:hypothetical protein